jgi:3'-phosphoadenosine 5'-phosphosulfate sulfotransferase (PAPS reductase)/FAD synthetase
VIGKAKEKGSDSHAVYGDYPMKDLALHGLKLDVPIHLVGRELELFEVQSLNIIKESLLLPGSPVVSSSYGADSVVVQSLVNKVYPSIATYHGKTGLNYPEVYAVEKELITRGIMKKDMLYYGKNKESYWKLVDEYGFNFDRKGDRRENVVGSKVSLSETCCNLLKHKPFSEAVAEQGWNINFAGIRADESRARDLAAKRDGPLYFAQSWNLYRVNPIIHWTDSMVWEYTKKESLPYAAIYDMVLKDKNDKVIYQPRVGCFACMLTAKYGYLKWLQTYKPKQYEFIMKDKGLLKLLYSKKFGHQVGVTETGKEYAKELEGVDLDELLGFLEQRPCFFDDTLATL